MNWFVAYLAIGAMLVGGAIGEMKKQCPDAEIEAVDAMAVALLWPAILTMKAQTGTPYCKEPNR